MGGHAWTEFYLPNVGWVPVDATWGQEGDTPMEPLMSGMGAKRGIPMVDYYFGKTDPYRITLFKDWNIALTPKPKTKGAQPVQPWCRGNIMRNSGVKSVVSGFEGVPGMGAG
jgi:transglutaminase-like putative cysteine protease